MCRLAVDIERLRCDFFSGTARKFLRGPRGIGFLYVADRMLERGAYPLFVDMRGARWTESDVSFWDTAVSLLGELMGR